MHILSLPFQAFKNSYSVPEVCLALILGLVKVYGAESVGGDDTEGGDATSLEILLRFDGRDSAAQSRFTFILEEFSSRRFPKLPDRAALFIRSSQLMPNVL